LGRGKFGEGHYHCGGAANATISEALKPFYSFFAASLATLRRSSLYGTVSRKEKRPFSISNSLQRFVHRICFPRRGYPKYDTSGKFKKVGPSQELSDSLVSKFKDIL